jgi:alpha-L-rhamnosidase
MTYASYINNTPYGKAGIYWKKVNGKFIMDVTIPVGSYATVYVPAVNSENILESGKKIEKANSVRYQKTEDGYVVFNVGSGKYTFEVK